MTIAVAGGHDVPCSDYRPGTAVDTLQGTVYLTGTVPRPGVARRAGELARQVDGVKAVVNNLRASAS